MKTYKLYPLLVVCVLLAFACMPPEPKTGKTITKKHNYIILLDLSDRLIVQDNQPERDIEIVKFIYSQFENRIKKNLYVRSRDEIKVVIAPQKGSGLKNEIFEDRLYHNMDNIPIVLRKKKEEQRRTDFLANLDTLYQQARFSSNPAKYYGADIWKYFYENLKTDYVTDTLTDNFLFVLTDGYPIVGKDLSKLLTIKKDYPELHIVLLEAAPRDKDHEWDRIMELWKQWFEGMNVKDYTFIKRMAISKEKDEIEKVLFTE